MGDKGKLRVFRSRDDALIHLTWDCVSTKSKTPQEPEDLIIFEGDCTAKLIPNKPGRVFFLKFRGDEENRKMFWFQTGDQKEDANKIDNLNKVLNNPSEIEDEIDPAGSRLAKSLPRHTGIRGLEEQIQQTDELLDRLLNEHGLQNAGVVPGFEHLDETRDEISQILEELKEIQGVGQVQISHDESEKEDEEEQSSGKGSCEDSEELASEDNNSEVANSEDSINSEEETKETD